MNLKIIDMLIGAVFVYTTLISMCLFGALNVMRRAIRLCTSTVTDVRKMTVEIVLQKFKDLSVGGVSVGQCSDWNATSFIF